MPRRVPLPQWLRRDRTSELGTVPGDAMNFDLRRPRPTSAPGRLAFFGAVFVVASTIAATGVNQQRRHSLPWPLTLGVGVALLGWAALASGERRRWNRVQAELTRAKAELDTLSEELRRAHAAGLNLSDVLKERGYAEFDVRRWIVRLAGLPPLAVRTTRGEKNGRSEKI